VDVARTDRWRPAALIGQFAWEGVLLLATVVVAVFAAVDVSGILTRGFVIEQIVGLGFIASGLALSLRTATPNLAVPVVAALSGGLAIEAADATGRTRWPPCWSWAAHSRSV
jgi:hypothetical protein